MDSVCRWAVLGPGAIARKFIAAAAGEPNRPIGGGGELGPGPRPSAGRRDRRRDQRQAAYAEVLADPSVDAVYIATVHTSHARLALAAIAAGKHVLIEKPLAPNAGSVMAVIDAARPSGVIAIEAYMYRFHPQTRLLLQLVADGAIGRLRHIDASFSFAVANPTGRLFDPELAGGGILDVRRLPGFDGQGRRRCRFRSGIRGA